MKKNILKTTKWVVYT